MELLKRKCKRCGYTWIARKLKKPKLCAKCRNSLWDTDRKYKKRVKE